VVSGQRFLSGTSFRRARADAGCRSFSVSSVWVIHGGNDLPGGIVFFSDMTAAQTIPSETAVDRVFGVLAEASTYKQFVLLFVGFPLSIFCFVTTAALVSVGIGLTPIVVGVGILAIALWLVTMYARAERFLLAEVAGGIFRPEVAVGPGLKGHLLNPAAWKRVAYFALRLPISIIGFSAAVAMVVSFALLFAPLLYTVIPMRVGFEEINDWQIALLVACVGAVMGLGTAHAIRAIVGVQRRVAEWLL